MNIIATNAAQAPIRRLSVQDFTALLTARGAIWGPWLERALAVHRQRRHLARLSAHDLNDIGLDRATAQREAARRFWDLP